MEITITLAIIIITCIVSIIAFSNEKVMNDLIFYPPAVTNDRQWYRFFSSGLIHADLFHLAFNMIALYMFGDFVEETFENEVFGSSGKLLYLLMYIAALWVSMIPTYRNNRDNSNYRSLGASGAVSAVVFAGLILEPRAKIGFFFIPPVIPGYIFGPIYLIASTYMEKRQGDNINHSAHIWGALFGLAFLIVGAYALSDYKVVQEFINKVRMDIGV